MARIRHHAAVRLGENGQQRIDAVQRAGSFRARLYQLPGWISSGDSSTDGGRLIALWTGLDLCAAAGRSPMAIGREGGVGVLHVVLLSLPAYRVS